MSSAPKLRFKDKNGENYSDWEKEQIKDLGDTYSGLNGKTKENFGKGNCMYVTYTNIFNNIKIKEELNDFVEIDDKEKQNKILKGDLFFTASSETPNEAGMVSICDFEQNNLYLNSFCFGYRVENKNKYSPLFLAYLLRSNIYRQKISILAQGSTRYNLSKNEILKMKINIPSKEEQEKIASFLSLFDEKIELQEKKVESLKKYKKGMMQKIFSQEIRFKDENGEDYPEWEEKKLGEVCYIQGGYAFKSSDFKKSGIPIIRITNIDYTVSLNDSKTVYIDNDIDEKFEIKEGALLIAMSGSTGKIGLYNYTNKAYLNQRVGLFVKKENSSLEYKFLNCLLRSYQYEHQISQIVTSGVQANISPEDIEGLRFKFPSVPEQIKISSFLSIIDEKIKLEEEKLKQLQEYKKGLLQQMFV